MSAITIYREALYRNVQRIKKSVRGMPEAGCKHWYVPVKHACGPATKICLDCGREEAL